MPIINLTIKQFYVIIYIERMRKEVMLMFMEENRIKYPGSLHNH